jgi:hypothetical protein
VTEGKVSGTLVLPEALARTKLKMAISNSLESGNGLQLETTDKHDTWYWRLTLTAKTKGLRHGCVREMLIDERVRKRS